MMYDIPENLFVCRHLRCCSSLLLDSAGGGCRSVGRGGGAAAACELAEKKIETARHVVVVACRMFHRCIVDIHTGRVPAAMCRLPWMPLWISGSPPVESIGALPTTTIRKQVARFGRAEKAKSRVVCTRVCGTVQIDRAHPTTRREIYVGCNAIQSS